MARGRCRSCSPVKHVFAQTQPVNLEGQILTVVTLAIVHEPGLHSDPNITKKRLNT